MMATVYAVSSGSYSDYGIEYIFATRELAEAFLAREHAVDRYSDYNEVEEWELLTELPVKTATYNAYGMLKPDGSLTDVSIAGHTHRWEPDGGFEPLDAVWIGLHQADPRLLTEMPPGGIRLNISYRRSREEAEKALQDFAAQVKARIEQVG